METGAAAVIAGVDTHKDARVLCGLDSLGRKIVEAAFPAAAEGCRGLARTIGDPAACLAVGVEGACSFGAGLTAHLLESGLNVVEVLRPKRGRRRRGSRKNGFADAEGAARAAMSGEGASVPKSRDGWAEAARPALRAGEIPARTQTRAVNAAKGPIDTAPEPIRAKYSRLGGRRPMGAPRRRRPPAGDAIAGAPMLSLSALAETWLDAEAKAGELESHIERIVREKAPAMPEIDGCGALSAAGPGLAAGDSPGRMRSEASFAMLCGASPIEAPGGKTARHRLNRRGSRRANRALHGIVINRMRSDERTSDCIAKRASEGKSGREAMRCPKRYVAREAYGALM